MPQPAPPPEPDPPLTDRERRLLADIGTDLQESDPRLGQRLSARPGGSGLLSVDYVVQAVALLVIVLVLSAVITPPDVASQIIVAVPVLILYQISIYISSVVLKRQAKAQKNARSSR